MADTPSVQDFVDGKTDLDDGTGLSGLINGTTTVTTRTGGNKDSYSQLVSRIAHGDITTYSAAATYSSVTDWVDESGIVYRPLPSALPIGPEVFNSANWVVVQYQHTWQFNTVADLKNLQATTGTIGEITEIISRNPIVKTVWNNTTSKAGGAEYEIKTRAQHRTDIGDAGWVPDGFGDHYLLGGTTYVAVIQTNGVINVAQFGAIGDDITDDSSAINSAVSYGAINKSRVLIYGDHFLTDKILLDGSNHIEAAGAMRISGTDEGISIRGSNILLDGITINAEAVGGITKGVINFLQSADLLQNIKVLNVEVNCDVDSGTPITDHPGDITKLRKDIEIRSPTLTTVRTDTFHYGILIQSTTERLKITDFDITLPTQAANPVAIYGNATEFHVGEGRIHSGGHSGIACSPSTSGTIANNQIKGITTSTEAAIEIEYKASHALDPAAGSGQIVITGNLSSGCNTGLLITHRDGSPTTAQLPNEIVTSGNQFLNCTGRALNLQYGRNISIGKDYYHSSGSTEAALIGTIGEELEDVSISAKFKSTSDDAILIANGGTDVILNGCLAKSLLGRAVTISSSATEGVEILGGKYEGTTRGISDDGSSAVSKVINTYVRAGSSTTITGLPTGSTVGNVSYEGTAPSLGGGVITYNNNSTV